MLGFALAALVVALPPASTPSQQQPGSGIKAADGVSQATAVALARAVSPADLMIPMQVDQSRRAILALPTLDEDARQAELTYPGLYGAVWKAVEPEFRRSAELDLPPFFQALEQLYLARLTEREAQALLAFYKSSTGQKLLHGMYVSFDATAALVEMVKSESASIDAKQLQAAADAAKAKVIEQMGPEDETALRTLAASIDRDKAEALSAETQRITLEWVNKEDSAGDERIGKIIEAAAKAYMAAHSVKK